MKFVSVLTSDALGGAEFAAASMLDALQAAGHEVVMLTDQPAIAREIGIPVTEIALGPKLSTRSYRRLALSWPRELLKLKAALDLQRPYDALIVHYKKEQLLASMLPSRYRRTLLWAEWGPVPFPIRQGVPRRAYLAAARRAKAIMAVSAGTKRSVCEVGVPSDRIHVVPNAVRSEEITFRPDGRERVRAELGIPADAFVVGCISRLHPKKRNDVVVQAALALGEVHLVIAGEGETEQELRRIAEPLGERAHFIATPGADSIADVMSSFDVSVFCPSPTEGAPRAVILGMLAERPCLSTGPEGVADMIDSRIGGIADPENDADALLALIRPYLAERDLARQQGERARKLAIDRYGPTAVARRIEQLVTS